MNLGDIVGFKYTEKQIQQAVNLVVGDDGTKANEILNALRIMTGKATHEELKGPKMRHWIDEDGNFRFEVIE